MITDEPLTNLGNPIIESIKNKIFQVENNGFNGGTSFWYDPDKGV